MNMEDKKKKRLSLGGSLIGNKRMSLSFSQTIDDNDDDTERIEIEKLKSARRRSSISGKPPRKSLLLRRAFAPIDGDNNAYDTAPSPTKPQNDNQFKSAKDEMKAEREPVKREHAKQGVEAPRLKDDQLSDLYTECIKLATTNKINQQNTWSLHLIDNMEDVMNQEDEEAGEEKSFRQKNSKNNQRMFNFQKASCTLDASVMIYSYRVDSVHKDTYKVLGSFSRGGPGGQEDEPEAAGGEGVDEEGKKKKPARRTFTSTIETNLSNLNVKTHEISAKTDPLFQKTSASFDQGGARGLLLNNLNVYNGTSIAFDSEIIPDGVDVEEVKAEDTENPLDQMRIEQRKNREKENKFIAKQASHNLNLSDLKALFHRNVAKVSGGANPTMEGLKLCPILDQFYDMLKQGPNNRVEESEGESDNNNDGGVSGSDSDSCEPCTQDMADDLDHGGEADVELIDVAIEQEEKLFQQMQHSLDDGDIKPVVSFPLALAACCGAPVSPGGMSANGEDYETNEGIPEVPLIFSDQKEEFAYMDSEILKNWAGANHWKFKAPKVDKQSEGKPRGGGERNPKSKTAFKLDFFAPHINAIELAAPTKLSTNVIAKATLSKADPVKYVLPVDHGYRLSNLHQMFTKPTLFVRFQKMSKNHIMNQKNALSTPHESREGLKLAYTDMSPMGDGLEGAFDNDSSDDNEQPKFQFKAIDGMQPQGSGGGEGGDDEEDGEYGAGITDLGEGELVAQPNRVEKIDISYAKFAKKVNVRQLKDTLWDTISNNEALDTETETETKKSNVERKEGTKKDEVVPRSFQNALTALPQKQSVAFCFICLLHLCNEKGLRLEKKPLAKQSSTFPEETPQRYRDDIDHNLADFRIHLPTENSVDLSLPRGF